jgi:hypothetical protein
LKYDDISSELTSFAKKTWVTEYFAPITSLSKYISKEEANNFFLKKEDADVLYLTKETADGTYAKITDIPDNVNLDNYATKNDIEPMAKRTWVNEYFMRKFESEGFKNALILSTEFTTRPDFYDYYDTDNPQQGFYYLTDGGENGGSAEMWVIVNNGDVKAKANLTTGEMTISQDKLKFAGPAALQW